MTSWKERLAAAYIEVVAASRRGDSERARTLLTEIVGELTRAIEDAWAQARRAFAAGDPYGALYDLSRILEFHHENMLQLELPVSKAACFTEIARVLAAMDLSVGAAAAMRHAAGAGDGFYRPSPSCQIPILGGLFETLFGARADGTFVEVGAFDGETFSNTSCLADLGWRGLYVEPVERMAAKCRARHQGNPNVTTLTCAIGPTETTIRFWDHGAFSTGTPEAMPAEALLAGLDTARLPQIEVAQMRLDRALAEAGIEPGFELLVVDVEGMEEAVFDSFDIARWRPLCLIVELVDASTMFAGQARVVESSRRLRAALTAHGYAEVYRDLGNTVFRLADPANGGAGSASD